MRGTWQEWWSVSVLPRENVTLILLLFLGCHGICRIRYRVEGFQSWCSNASHIDYHRWTPNYNSLYLLILQYGFPNQYQDQHRGLSRPQIELRIICSCFSFMQERATPRMCCANYLEISLVVRTILQNAEDKVHWARINNLIQAHVRSCDAKNVQLSFM